MQLTPTFIKLFANDAARGTEYIAIDTITKVHVVPKELPNREVQTTVEIFTLEGARRTVTGDDAELVIATLDSLSPGVPAGTASTGEVDVT